MGKPSPDELDASRKAYDEDGYYNKKLKQGLEFQDFCVDVLYKHGIVIVTYASKKYQNTRGENVLGAEIKNDARFWDTGKLCIEMAEKAHPDNARYVPSGICRDDNAWLYVIGDRKKLWMFTIVMLRGLSGRDKYRRYQTPTSRGFLLPVEDAEKYVARIVIP